MKTVLVTGGAGFIGSHLCETLLESGYRVICLDNLFTGNQKNIERLRKNENFSFVNHDIINPIELGGAKIDEIYNLACPASPVNYQINPIETIKANTMGVINVLELAKAHKAKILQTSTSEVYGDPLCHPQKEDYRGNVNTIGPRDCYDEGKRVAETLFFDYQRHYNIAIRVARIFNTYGPNMSKNDGRVISNFIVQALNGNSLTVYGNGNQTRSFCYVSDMIDGLCKLMGGENFTGPVNLGNPVELKIVEIAEKILELTGAKTEIIFKPLPIDDPAQRQPNIDLAKEMLGWRPRIGLEQGLARTIDYFKKIL